MLKRPEVLVGVALLVAAVVFVVARRAGPSEAQEGMQPLKLPPGESLRVRPPAPQPVVADPKAALAAAPAEPLAGDKVILALLKAALDAGEAPTFRSSMDLPFDDNAGQQVKDELHEWLGRKMAGLGFVPAAGKPTVSWVLRVNPSADGSYAIQVLLRASGETRFDQPFVLPKAWSKDRLDTSFAAAFAPPGAPAARETKEAKP